MGFNSYPDSKRTVPLVVRFDQPDGEKRTVSFPGGVDKSLQFIAEQLLFRTERMGYKLHPGWCYGYLSRDIAGTDIPSKHGRGGGRALDINAPANGRGTRGDIPMNVVEMWEHHGWTWGGRWDYTDPMHVEANEGRLFYWRLARKMKREIKRNKRN